MQISRLSIKNFRNFAIGDFEFKERTIVTGANGSGKTSLVEAIYYLSSFKSFRSSSDAKVLKIGETEFVVNIDGEREGEKFNMGLQYQNLRKAISCNRERVEKLTDGFGIFLSAVLSIYDKQLSHPYSIYRRKYADRLISTIDDEYFASLLSYHSVLKQKNNLLKNNFDLNLIDTYSSQMSKRSEYIYEKRIEFASYFEDVLNGVYAQVFGREELIKVKYFSSKDGGDYTDTTLFESAKKKRDQEIKKRRSVCGVHLDDYIITVDGKPISEFGSEGEKILLGITLKVAEIQLIYENKGEYPIIMIDDAFSELDSKKRKSLLDIFETYPQVIITYPKNREEENGYHRIDLDEVQK